MISSRDGLIFLLQDSNAQTSTLSNKVLAITEALLATLPEDPLTAEIESSMLDRLIKPLKGMRA